MGYPEGSVYIEIDWQELSAPTSQMTQSFGRGAYTLYGDKVEWSGALYALQAQLGLNVYPGGKTALELKGYAHYLPTGKRKVFLYGKQGQVLPSWFSGKRLGVDIVMTRTNLFPKDSQ